MVHEAPRHGRVRNAHVQKNGGGDAGAVQTWHGRFSGLPGAPMQRNQGQRNQGRVRKVGVVPETDQDVLAP